MNTFQLGDIKFQGLMGFDSISSKTESVLAEHQLIDGKPLLQHLGSKLEEITLVISLDSQFCNPEQEIDKFEKHRADATILTMINGQGVVLGDYVIKSIQKDIENITPGGQLVSAQLSISLVESWDADKQTQAEQDARNGAFATVDKMPPVATGSGQTTLVADAMKDVGKINTDAKLVDDLLGKAKKFQADANTWMDKASGKAGEIRTTINTLQEKINGLQHLGDRITGLSSNIGGLVSSLTALTGNLDAHNLQGSSLINSLFQGQVLQFFTSSTPLSNWVATRKG